MNKALRRPRQNVSFAIQEALEVGKLLKRLEVIFCEKHEESLALLKKRQNTSSDIKIQVSRHELGKLVSALRDYVTVRIANVVDDDSSTWSLKDFIEVDLDNGNSYQFNLKKIKKVPQIKAILDARHEWVCHLSKRFGKPIDTKLLYSPEIVAWLGTLQALIATQLVREK